MKIPAYLTVEELRSRAYREKDKIRQDGGSRFIGTTEPKLALHYFSKNGAILECGPHFGMFTKFLQDEGFTNIHTLDFFNALEFPKKENLPFHEIDFNRERMPYADDFFDGVTAWGIIEHMENPFHFTREVHRVMKDGGIYIMALPNVFHIMSRLLFLKKGVFPRWDVNKNHIFVLPRGVFEKTILRYFDLVETRYTKPGFQFLFFDRFSRLLPANEWFGNFVIYVLKKKKFVPFGASQ